MNKNITLQSQFASEENYQTIFSIRSEVATAPTAPLLHQMSRLLFITKGEGTLRLQDQEIPLQIGSLVSILPWQISSITTVTQALSYTTIQYYFDGINDILKRDYNLSNDSLSIFEQMSLHPVVQCTSSEATQIRSVIDSLSHEQSEEESTYSKLLITNRIIELILLYLKFSASSPSLSNNTLDQSKLFRYLFLHLSEKITPGELAAIFYINESSLRSYIHDITGLSFNDLLNEMRVGKTIQFLLYTDFTLEEMSEILGFVDSSHISKVFQSRVGMRAKEYRNNYQKISQICKIRQSKASYQLVSYIYRNYDQPLTPQAVALGFGLTVPEMNQILLYYVEKNFETFLNFTRVNHACELLITTNLALADLAIEVGFNSTKTLSRNFIKYQKMTPGNYRKNQKSPS